MNRFIFSISFILLALGKCECEKDSLTDYDGMGGIESKVDGDFFRPSGGGLYGNKRAYFDGFEEGEDFLILSYSGEINDEYANLSLKISPIDRNNAIGKTFTLEKETENHTSSFATFSKVGEDFHTSDLNRGGATIDFFSFETGVVSGSFWFDAQGSSGEIVKLREGKFDMNFR